jgi:hypothetical protein
LRTSHHELSIALVVQRAWMPGSRRDVGFDDLPDEQVVAPDLAAVVQLSLQAGTAGIDQRRGDPGAGTCAQAEAFELVDLRAAAVADADHRIQQFFGRQLITQALLRRINSTLWLSAEIMQATSEG